VIFLAQVVLAHLLHSARLAPGPQMFSTTEFARPPALSSIFLKADSVLLASQPAYLVLVLPLMNV
jgi:hypothetical protein